MNIFFKLIYDIPINFLKVKHEVLNKNKLLKKSFLFKYSKNWNTILNLDISKDYNKDKVL